MLRTPARVRTRTVPAADFEQREVLLARALDEGQHGLREDALREEQLGWRRSWWRAARPARQEVPHLQAAASTAARKLGRQGG